MKKYLYATTYGSSSDPTPRSPGDNWEMCGSTAVYTHVHEIIIYWFWKAEIP